ncbi:MAG: serine/threonine protein kinase [Planctomycetota bacterium]|nr:MAG: serine/threonine protein kinase [Planctomycetota bacterium]
MSGIPAELGGLEPRYEVRRELARGGMGVVYEAFDRVRGAPCALKLLEGQVRRTQAARFRREAMLGARLAGHPGIVAPYDAGVLPSRRLYCVMELVEGGVPFDRYVRGLPRERAVRLVVEVARAVAYAHERGVVHRDLKPANVLVDAQGRARLTDFGVAKNLDEGDGLTATGAVVGTLDFMPPEQLLDSKRVDERSDVYGLGALLYVALTGRPPLPLQRLSLREALLEAPELTVPSPRQHDPSIDRGLATLCLRALARNPAERHEGALVFARDLEAWLDGDRAPRPLPSEHRRSGELSPFAPALVLAAGLAVLGALALFLWLR